jgi:hypothetical protein
MAFTHIPKAQLPLFSLYTRVVFVDAAEFTLCYDLHLCSPCCLGRYFILPLNTPHFCDASGLANQPLGGYRYRTFTGECGPASLDAQNKKTFNIKKLILKVWLLGNKWAARYITTELLTGPSGYPP